MITVWFIFIYMLSAKEIKQKLGEYAAQLVQPGMIVGIGTGSTANFFIRALARRLHAGLKCTCVPTSKATKSLAEELDMPLTTLNEVSAIDLDIDGADEIDPQRCLIKGGGGALLQEKMVADASKQVVIIADSSKWVKQLGAFPLPVEVIPYGWKHVQQRIMVTYNIPVKLRLNNGPPFITDLGHYILDCNFNNIEHPKQLCGELNNIPGVVENGLFVQLAGQVIIGFSDGTIETINK
jgi:ribose 5-phosphate isomerase A